MLTLVNYNYHKMMDFDEFSSSLFANTANEIFQYFQIKEIPPDNAPGVRYGEYSDGKSNQMVTGEETSEQIKLEEAEIAAAYDLGIVGGWDTDDYKEY